MGNEFFINAQDAVFDARELIYIGTPDAGLYLPHGATCVMLKGVEQAFNITPWTLNELRQHIGDVELYPADLATLKAAACGSPDFNAQNGNTRLAVCAYLIRNGQGNVKIGNTNNGEHIIPFNGISLFVPKDIWINLCPNGLNLSAGLHSPLDDANQNI